MLEPEHVTQNTFSSFSGWGEEGSLRPSYKSGYIAKILHPKAHFLLRFEGWQLFSRHRQGMCRLPFTTFHHVWMHYDFERCAKKLGRVENEEDAAMCSSCLLFGRRTYYSLYDVPLQSACQSVGAPWLPGAEKDSLPGRTVSVSIRIWAELL